MGKFIKSIVAGVLALSMATWGAPVWAAVQESDTISVSVSIGTVGSYSLSASLVDLDGDGSMTFSTSSVSTSSPWVVANDYIDVDFSAPTNDTWGVRIITDNAADLLGLTRDLTSTNYLFVDADVDGVYDSGETIVSESLDGSGSTVFGTITYGDTTVVGNTLDYDSDDADSDYERSYAGLIDASTSSNPTLRASIAFMVDGYDTTGTTTTPSIPTSAPAVDESHGGSSEVGDWDDTWYWLGDKSNSEYDDLVDRDQDGVADTQNHIAVYSYYFDGTNYWFTPNYSLIAYGTTYGRYVGRPGPGEAANDGSINSRPLADIGTPSFTNQWDIYVYLCGKFASTDWTDDPSGTDFVLPAGDYATNIYLELYNQE